LRIAWIGFHEEGAAALEALLDSGAPIVAVITLTEDKRARCSGALDFEPLCSRHKVPLLLVDDINATESVALLRKLELDLLLVIGWSQILGSQALGCAKLGAIGAHASLLPHNRGRAPVNWAIIHGDTQTGNTLMWLSPEVDKGEIIDQRAIPILPYDTCQTIYDKVAITNREMLCEVLPRLLRGERPGHAQPDDGGRLLPRRQPSDGQIEWAQPAKQVYDFIRAQTFPYPGAFSWLQGKCWTVWAAALLADIETGPVRPGTVVGPLISPFAEASGQLVSCGQGMLALLKLQARPDGAMLESYRLAEMEWAGRVWTNGG